MENSDWAIAELLMASLFFVIGFIFAVLKEKAAGLIAGYNFKSKEERKKYDERRMTRDLRDTYFIYGANFLVGTVATYFGGPVFFWISFVIFIAHVFKNLHINSEKEFGKYRREN